MKWFEAAFSVTRTCSRQKKRCNYVYERLGAQNISLENRMTYGKYSQSHAVLFFEIINIEIKSVVVTARTYSIYSAGKCEVVVSLRGGRNTAVGSTWCNVWVVIANRKKILCNQNAPTAFLHRFLRRYKCTHKLDGGAVARYEFKTSALLRV